VNKYDIHVPCLDCINDRLDPSLFKLSFLKRASLKKAAVVQCNQNFHFVSIDEMQTILPVSSYLDLNL
jgi:hypothetical protein